MKKLLLTLSLITLVGTTAAFAGACCKSSCMHVRQSDRQVQNWKMHCAKMKAKKCCKYKKHCHKKGHCHKKHCRR